jgi:hypothetical protein
VAVGGDEFEEEFEVVVFDVGVDELLALAIHDADVHWVRVEIDSAVELRGGSVILHTINRGGAVEAPVSVIRLITRGVFAALPALAPDDSTNPKGFDEYQIHWSESGRATSVGKAEALGRPRRSVLPLGAAPTRDH